MNLIELSNYSFYTKTMRKPFSPFNFNMGYGDVVSVSTDSPDDVLVLFKALATIIPPLHGMYRYKDTILDFSDYRKLLTIKKNIGFITSHAALISNRTVRENLLLMRSYYDNTLTTDLDQQTRELCQIFSLENKLELRPTMLTNHDYRYVVTVRELIKKPEVLLLEYPEKYIGLKKLEAFNHILSELVSEQMGIVFLSEYKHFIETFSKRNLVISKGTLRIK